MNQRSSHHPHSGNKEVAPVGTFLNVIFKIDIFVFRFFDGILPPYLSSVLSVYTPSRTVHSSSDGGKTTLSCARWKLKGFGYRSFSVQAPLVQNNLPAHTSDSAVLSHSSKRLLNHFSLLLPTLSYSNPFTGIGCCT